MRLGVTLPSRTVGGRPLRADSLAEAAGQIEAAGFASAWTFDSLGRGFLVPDPLIAVSVAATVTRDIALGTGVLQVPLRNPVDLAHRVLTAHLVCGGRLLLGVGAGSMAADFAAVGVDFAARFRLLDQGLATMRALWSDGRVGEAALGGAWPDALGGPPVLIGSWAGSRWIERAAREFEGWVASGARSSWGKVAAGIARFRALGGRRAVLTNVAVDLDLAEPSPDGPDDPCDLRGPERVARERLARLGELGFDDVVLVPRRHDADHLLEVRALA
jgi:alkanesulfonate monooxygenase SsuD/methylene tetrahydromethanopterin reductase-like flavin-dependent oxidoreductase (luciferase family)